MPVPAIGGPGGRFVLGPTAPTESTGPQSQLPAAYGTGRLLLMARDPHWLYAHWDLTDSQLNAYNRQSSTGHLALRVYRKSLQTPPILEQDVHPESRNWFLNVPTAGTAYLAELGYPDRQGVWQRISTSAATLTPSDELSGETWVRFETVPFATSRERVLALVKEATAENPPLLQAVLESTTPPPSVPTTEGFGPAPTPAAPPDSHAPARPSGRPGPATFPTPAWSPEKERALAEMISIDEVRRVWIGSLEITELLRRHLARGPSSAELLALAAGAAGAGGELPSLEAISSVSSPFGGATPPSRRGFRFEVNAELIVYGATEPDAEVTIGGRRIRLRPDGSFSYRFSLPDGQYALPIVATSADTLEQRSADLSFVRASQYQGGVGTHPQDAALRPPSPENVA